MSHTVDRPSRGIARNTGTPEPEQLYEKRKRKKTENKKNEEQKTNSDSRTQNEEREKKILLRIPQYSMSLFWVTIIQPSLTAFLTSIFHKRSNLTQT